jgi:hypothetical protein
LRARTHDRCRIAHQIGFGPRQGFGEPVEGILKSVSNYFADHSR